LPAGLDDVPVLAGCSKQKLNQDDEPEDLFIASDAAFVAISPSSFACSFKIFNCVCMNSV
jgi:hypothetical protein